MSIQTVKIGKREFDVFVRPDVGAFNKHQWKASAAYTVGRGSNAEEALRNWEKHFFKN